MVDWTPLPKSTDDEIEVERLRDLREAFEERSDLFDGIEELSARFRPGTHGAHEALHTASIVMELHAARLLDHPAVLIDPQAYRLASRAHEFLFDLYQYLGAVHLDVADRAGS